MTRSRPAALAATAALSASLLGAGGASAHSSPIGVTAAGSPLASSSAVIGGARWPGRPARILYFDKTEQKWAVKQAVKAWNSSGARVRFVPVPRRRAKLVITNQRGTRSDSFVSGFATLGYVWPGGSGMQLSRLEHPRKPHYSMAGVAAHELGHVLGLDHEDRRCAAMNTVLWDRCGITRACRLLERDDIAGAVKMYGGKVRMVQPGFCPRPPADVRVTGDPREYAVTLAWTNARGPFFERVYAARGKDACPRQPPMSGGGLVGEGSTPGGPGALRDDGLLAGETLATGRYCYSLWTVGENNQPVSRRKTIWVDFAPSRPGAPAGLTATPGTNGEVALAWTPSGHPEEAQVEGAAALDRCPASPDDGDAGFVGERAATAVLYQPGRYCFAVWTRDTLGALAGPATVWADYRGYPPEAAVYASENPTARQVTVSP